MTASIGELVEVIEKGEYDEDLAALFVAARQRANEIGMRWRIKIDGDEWDEDMITIGEMRLVEKLTGTNWAELRPLVSAEVAQAFIVAHFHKIDGNSIDDAVERTEALGARAVVEAVSEYVPQSPGKDQAAPTN